MRLGPILKFAAIALIDIQPPQLDANRADIPSGMCGVFSVRAITPTDSILDIREKASPHGQLSRATVSCAESH